MESNSEASCISDPNFAVICAFLERFASSCGITYPPFLDLQEMLENIEQVPQELVDLHIILLRKARRSVFREKWEKALVKFCQTYSAQDGWEIERFGYKNSRLEVKLRVLKTLLEGQFDLNCKFKTAINTLESTELRSKPLGKDKHGKIYWLQIDPTSNIRVYREDPDEESWTLVAKDRDSLVHLLQELTADEESVDVSLLNEDSSVSVDMEKTILDTGQDICNGENDDLMSNGDLPCEEKDPLEIKDANDGVSDVKIEESHSDVVTDNEMKVIGDGEQEQDLKNAKLDEVNGDEVGEAIEDPVMHVYGEGSGVECDAGNPDKEDNKSDENTPTNEAEQSDSVSTGQTNAEMIQKVEMEIKPQPKLWSIDTICGTGNLNHSGESSKSARNSQKNFSSFSIESVLEKKTDAGQSSSSAAESPVISVNTIGVNNIEAKLDVTNVNDINDQIISADNVSESVVCNASSKEILPSADGTENETKIEDSVNEIDAVPIAEKAENAEDSTVCAEKISVNSRDGLIETKIDEVQGRGDPEITKQTQLDKGNEIEFLDKSDTVMHDPEVAEVTQDIGEYVVPTDPKSTFSDDIQDIAETVRDVETSEMDDAKLVSEVKEIPEELSDMTTLDVGQTSCESLKDVNTNEYENETVAAAPLKSGGDAQEMVVAVKNENYKSEDNEIELNKEEIPSVKIEAEEGIIETKTEKLEIELEPSKSEMPEEDMIINNVNVKPDDLMKVQTSFEATSTPEPFVDFGGKEPSAEESTMGKSETVDEVLPEGKDKLEDPVASVNLDDTHKSDEVSMSLSACKTAMSFTAEAFPNSEPIRSVQEDNGESPAVEDTVRLIEPTDNGIVGKTCGEIVESTPADAGIKVEADTQKINPVELPMGKEEDGNSVQVESISETAKSAEEEKNTVLNVITVKEEVMNQDTLSKNENKEIGPAVLNDKLEPIDETIEVLPTVLKDENEMEVDVSLQEVAEEKAVEPSSAETTNEEAISLKEGIVEAPPTEILHTTAEEGVVIGDFQEEAANCEAKPADTSVENYKEETLKNDTVDADQNEGEEGQSEMSGKIRKIETRRTSRSQKPSAGETEAGQVPGRATRSGKKSIDEDTECAKEPIVKATRKRKSQDTVDEPAVEVETLEVGETSATVKVDQPTEADSKKPEEKLDSTVNSVTDENPTVPQEERSKVVRRRKKRGKRSRVQKTVEVNKNQQENSSDEDKKPVGNGEEATNEEEIKIKVSKSKPKDTTPRTRQLIPERELKLLGISNMEELPTVRQSRRIAQLKLKEEAERNRIKKLEEEAAKEEEEAKKWKKKKKKASKSSTKKRKGAPTGEESYEEEEDDDDDDEEAKAKKEKKRKKKKDKLVFNELNPWISSTESSTADEEEDEIEDEPHEDEEILFKSDHEFSPESDIEDPDYKPIKRARTAKVDPKEATDSDTKYDDTACEKCGEKDHPEWILLCDKCDKGWHASCVRPALMVVPEGDWFCPPCEHLSLVQKLRESLVEYDRCQKQRENEELRKKRLAFVGISLDNVLPAKKDKKLKPIEQNEGESDETASGNADDDSSSSGSSDSDSSSSEVSDEPVYQLRERRSNITSYRYNEYDELIKSALQEEIEAVKGVGLGKGKDITNQAGEYDEDEKVSNEEDEEENAETQNAGEIVNSESTQQPVNPYIPRDILQAKPRIKAKKDNDRDYEADTDAEDDDEEYNQEENEGDGEEEDELVDELPPVIPRYDKKKKKSRSLNVRGLDFTSDEEEEDNSDSDFKGESSEEESEYSLPSESESSDGVRRHKKNYDGPVRRSTRARTARYDREFINDESEDESPRRKRSRNMWVESESSDSDRSWGKKKKRSGRSGNRSTVPKKKMKSKGRKKKKSSKKRNTDSDNDYGQKLSKKVKNPKIKYGGLDDLDEEQVLTRRTRGKKINYQEMNPSDSDEEVVKKKPRVIAESDEEFVAEKEKSGDSEDDEMDSKREANGKAVSKKLIMQKMKKKKRKIIPDPDDFSEDDLLEDEELDEFAEELEDLDEEEGSILEEMLRDGNVPIHELKEALRKLRERRKDRTGDPQPYPPIPDHMENPGSGPKFPKIGKMKITPSRAELAAQLGIAQETVVANVRATPGVLLGNPPKEGLPISQPDNIPPDPAALLLMNEQKDSKDAILNLQPPPYPFSAEAPPTVPPTMVTPHHQFPVNSRPPIPPFNSFQGIITQPQRLPPEYPHTNIPTTVLGIENDALRNQGRKPPVKTKRKNEEGLSPQGESGEENSGDGRLADSLDSSPKRRGRGRGKKQLLAEAQAKQELGISTVQAPTQFPSQGLPPEGGSVITRMLNTPQGPQPFADFSAVRGRPPTTFRPPYPTALRPPLNPPTPTRLRAPAPGLFHASHPLDPSSSAINLPQTKPSPLPPGFPARPPVLPRYPSDPSLRAPFPSQSPPSRSETYPYPNFYEPYRPTIPNSDDAPFHNPNFPNHPFDEHHPPPHIDGSGGPSKVVYDEEGGEFGGLASYFASQREDDLDT